MAPARKKTDTNEPRVVAVKKGKRTIIKKEPTEPAAKEVKIEPDTDFKSPVKTVKQEAPTATVKKEAKTESDNIVQAPIKKNDRNNMAFAKGTYVIRFEDVDTERDDHLWRVDNHQLLQYYKRSEADDPKSYDRTNRYTGWFCSEDWKFLPVNVQKKVDKEEKVVVDYPDKDYIMAKKERYDAKMAELEQEKN